MSPSSLSDLNFASFPSTYAKVGYEVGLVEQRTGCLSHPSRYPFGQSLTGGRLLGLLFHCPQPLDVVREREEFPFSIDFVEASQLELGEAHPLLDGPEDRPCRLLP